MTKQTITLNVTLDDTHTPEHIEWTAPGAGTLETPKPAKALLLSLWDGEEKASMRIDLWTKRMMVDEMNDLMVQTLLSLGETYARATKDEELAHELIAFAKNFKDKADEKIKQQQNA